MTKAEALMTKLRAIASKAGEPLPAMGPEAMAELERELARMGSRLPRRERVGRRWVGDVYPVNVEPDVLHRAADAALEQAKTREP